MWNEVEARFSAIDGIKFIFHGAPAHAAACPEKLTWRLFTDDALLEKIKKDHFEALKEI